jgi:16S rRNA (guanine527-N7)-methyltransferase
MLAKGIQTLGLDIAPDIQARLLEYVNLLVKWNRVYNLTSVRKPQDMIARHILDSLAVLPYVQGPRILDIGTGAGLPGMVFALTRPDWEVVMVDSSNKKLRFVRQAIVDLGLNNASAEHIRIEEYQPAALFDTVISRAFSSLEEMVTHGLRLRGPDGVIVAMKGVYPMTEIEALSDASLVKAVERVDVPELNAERHVVILGAAEQD